MRLVGANDIELVIFSLAMGEEFGALR